MSDANAPSPRAIDALRTAVVLLDADLAILDCNPAAEALLGSSLARATGRPLAELLVSADELLQIIAKAASTGEAFSPSEMSVACGGHEHVLDCHASGLDTGGVLLELHDAGPRLRLHRDSTRQVQQSISRIISKQLAHEIRNPLAGMRGAAQLLQRQLPEQLQEHTRVIIEETDRISALLATMLGPEQPGRHRVINVHRALQDIARLLQAESRADYQVVEDYDPSLPEIRADADQLKQALLNLGRNSVQALGPGGTLILRTRVESGVLLRGRPRPLVVRIDFEDDGSGVPDELVDSLFYPLVTSRPDGTGLGLAVTQELVSRNDGMVRLRHTRNPTIFSLYLPVPRDG